MALNNIYKLKHSLLVLVPIIHETWQNSLKARYKKRWRSQIMVLLGSQSLVIHILILIITNKLNYLDP